MLPDDMSFHCFQFAVSAINGNTVSGGASMLMALEIRTCDGIRRDIRYKKMKNMMKLMTASLKNRNMGGKF